MKVVELSKEEFDGEEQTTIRRKFAVRVDAEMAIELKKIGFDVFDATKGILEFCESRQKQGELAFVLLRDQSYEGFLNGDNLEKITDAFMVELSNFSSPHLRPAIQRARNEARSLAERMGVKTEQDLSIYLEKVSEEIVNGTDALRVAEEVVKIIRQTRSGSGLTTL